jgi:Cobalt transport protein
MFKINVITQLLIFLIIAIIVNQLSIYALFVLATMLLAILMYKRIYQFMIALKRFKWLFFILLIVYSFNTPGEHVQNWPFSVSPTYEGVIAGITQTLRIAVVLAAITWIMTVNTKQQLISGFYFIFSPLTLFGLKVDRFSARLWLTLHYVELQRNANDKDNLMHRLKNMTTSTFDQESTLANDNCRHGFDVDAIDVIEFNMPKFQLIDYAVIIALLIAATWTLV